tara:strand:- start:1233 stop:1646 length:414 start_codon:yes stop_codon:yes gene_type:complete
MGAGDMTDSGSFCNVYNTTDLASNLGQIISGRVSVHSIIANTIGSGLQVDNGPAIELTTTGSPSALIKVALRYPPSSGSVGPGENDFRCFSNAIETGGDGVLFTDGVFVSQPDGPHSPGDIGSIATFTIFYTGGANT